mgnify:CR=1 FL=1
MDDVTIQDRAAQERAASARPLAPQEVGEGLSVISIAKSYDKRVVLSDVSLTVGKGEVVGLLGPNGAGKTTCFYSVMGLVRPDQGRIILDGQDITGLPMYRRAILGLGYLPQETSIFRGLTVEQNIGAVLEMAEPNKAARAEKLEQLLDEFGLTRLREDMGADEAAIRRWIGHWVSEGLAALETLIAQHGDGYAYGDRPTLADCHILPQVYNAQRFAVDLSPYPLLTASAARLHALVPDAAPEAQGDAG